MHAHRINIFDKTDGDHVVVLVPDNFQLKFFPAEYRLFHQNLADKTGLEASCTDFFQFFFIMDKAAACSAHCVSRAENNRITKLFSNPQSFFNTVGNLASGHLNSEALHRILEFDAVLSALNRIYLNTDDLYTVFIQHAVFCKLRTKIKTGLSAQIRQ